MTSRLRKVVRNIRIRLHALVVLLIVVWAGYAAVAYLVRSVFKETPIPQNFSHRVLPLDADSLRGDELSQKVSDLRTPVSHYHRIDRWFQPDHYNGCVLSGCHSLMPHEKIPAVRAFDNFHATFLACGMCHEESLDSPLQAQWVSTLAGQAQDSPDILKLIFYLEMNQDKINSDAFHVHETVVRLLTSVLQLIGGDSLLNHILMQLTTSEPGSPVWKRSIVQLTQEIPLHARGEYGAKLVPSSQLPYRAHYDKMTQLAKNYFETSKGAGHKRKPCRKIHGSLRKEPQKCSACHRTQNPLLDFEQLGYTPKRVELLEKLPVARQMEKIQQGQRFHIKTHLGVSP